MSWFKLGILSGKIAAKRAETLTNDWITLAVERTANKGEYSHPTLENGVYCVKIGDGSYDTFIVETGKYAVNMSVSESASSGVPSVRRGIYFTTTRIMCYQNGSPQWNAGYSISVKKII